MKNNCLELPEDLGALPLKTFVKQVHMYNSREDDDLLQPRATIYKAYQFWRCQVSTNTAFSCALDL